MCVIAVKEAGYLLPPEANLRKCFTSNSDGAGFAWSDEKTVHWQKGFLTFDEFYAALKSVFPNEESEKLSACIMHFRIGTHGPKKGATHTHPFPADGETIQATCDLAGATSMAVFHNGIMHSMDAIKHDKVLVNDTETDPSDSQIFTQEFVKPLWIAYQKKALPATTFHNVIAEVSSGSRIALLMKGNIIARYGSWAKSDDAIPGCFFSNESYKIYEPKIMKNSDYNDYSDGGVDSWNGMYWEKGNPHRTWADFDNYEKNLDKSKVQSETSVDFDPFWTYCSEFPIKKHAQIHPLPVETTIVDKDGCYTYDPAIDGNVFMLGTNDGNQHLYIEKLIDKQPFVFFIGRYTIKFPVEKGVKREQKQTSINKPATKSKAAV